MNPALLVGLIAAPFVLVGAYFAWRAEQGRRLSLATLARSRGWTYTLEDSYGLHDRWHGEPFQKGHARKSNNVLMGAVDGMAFVGFDYAYEESTGDSDTTYRFHVCALRLPTHLPMLQLKPENALTRLGSSLGLEDIELESEEFNRAYRVHCSDRKFASDVLTPRTMQQLLRGDTWCWRIEGQDLLVYARGTGNAAEIIARTSQMSRFIRLIPTFVWKDHGYDPPIATG